MTACGDRQAKQALRALGEGTLDAAGYARLRTHVAGCAECRDTYERLARVDSALEGRALPAQREELLRQELFARLEAASRSAPVAARRRFTLPAFTWPSVAGLAVAAVAVVVLMPRRLTQDNEWRTRGVPLTSAWGIRVFCVGPQGDVLAEARSGQTLVCGEGSSVQFSYTAPEAARLSVEARSSAGELLRFFPREGEAARVPAGVDMPLPDSTPVQGDWLSQPLVVNASFSDARGQVLSQTHLTLSLP